MTHEENAVVLVYRPTLQELKRARKRGVFSPNGWSTVIAIPVGCRFTVYVDDKMGGKWGVIE